MTAAEVGERVDSRELTDWVAYDNFHVSRTDALLATLCSLVYNSNRKPQAPERTAEHFLGRKRRSDPAAVARHFLAWAKVRGAKVGP